VEAGNFTRLEYSVVLNVGKSVLKMAETLWENSLKSPKDVCIMHGNFIVTAVTFSEKTDWWHCFALTSHVPVPLHNATQFPVCTTDMSVFT
jgi:hypothetical protein